MRKGGVVSGVPRDFSLKLLTGLVDNSEGALQAYLQKHVKPGDRARWTFIEGLFVRKLPRNEWRVRFRSCWLEGGYLGIWLNLKAFAARTRRVEGSIRDELNRRLYWNGGCDEARFEGRRFRFFAGRWKVLVALVVDFGSTDTRVRRSSDNRSTGASRAFGEASPDASNREASAEAADGSTHKYGRRHVGGRFPLPTQAETKRESGERPMRAELGAGAKS